MANGETPIHQMPTEEVENMINPLSDGDIEQLKDVEAIAEAATRLINRAEMAGMDMTAQKEELRNAQMQAKGILAAFGYNQA